MFAFLNSLVPDSVRGAQVLKILRWLSTAAGTATLTWLISKGVSVTDATSISAAIGGLILAVGSAAYSMWDAKNVGTKMNAAVTTTAHQTATAIEAGDGKTTQAIKVAAASGTPDAAKQVQAILAAGQE